MWPGHWEMTDKVFGLLGGNDFHLTHQTPPNQLGNVRGKLSHLHTEGTKSLPPAHHFGELA